MPARKSAKLIAEIQAASAPTTDVVRPVSGDHGFEPVASPAHGLQQALRDAGFRNDTFSQRPMSNAMLVLSLICVYVLAMMMMLGAISA